MSKLGPSNDNDIKIVDWEPQSKKLPESKRRTHLLCFTYLLQLSGIVALPLRWTCNCLCTFNARCNTFPYCLVLLMWLHSNLCEFLPPLLFVDGSLCANDVILLLLECHPERMKQWVILTSLLIVRSQERIPSSVPRRATWIMDMCLISISSFRPSGHWLEVASSNGLRSSSIFRSGARVLRVLTLRLFALAEFVKQVRLCQTMVEMWYCLDLVVPEGMGVEVIGGLQHKQRTLNTRLYFGTSAGSFVSRCCFLPAAGT